MSLVNFEVLNRQLAQLVQKADVFECGDFHLLKFVQYAIHHAAADTRIYQRPLFMLPGAAGSLLAALRSVKHQARVSERKQHALSLKRKNTLLIGGGNVIGLPNGNMVSANTKNLLEALGSEECLYMYNGSGRAPVETGQDLNLDDINRLGSLMTLSKETRKLNRALRKAFVRIRKSGLLSEKEMMHLAAQLQNFSDAFSDWLFVLKHLRPSRLLFTPHYYNEGLVYAARRMGIRTIELQHGLISGEDFYYVYPKAVGAFRHRALFADEIAVFGQYWKDVLLKGGEYSPEQIRIIGRYQYHPPVTPEAKEAFALKHRLSGKSVIAISCQTNNPDYYANYTHGLAERMERENPDWVIVLKPHPRQLGMDLLAECTRHENVRLMDKTESLMTLLALAEIQISIYSTTFFDAIGTDTINLSLQDDGDLSAYARSMIEAGVAAPLLAYENPVEVAGRVRASSVSLREDYVYSPFDRSFFGK
jgi:hypothetical protein